MVALRDSAGGLKDILNLRRRAVPVAGGLAAVAIAALLPAVGIDSYAIGQMQYVLVLIVVTQGLNIVSGFAGQLSLGPCATFAIGAYGAAMLVNWRPSFGFIGMVIASVIIATMAGVVTAMPALRIGGFYLGMVTLFLALLVPTVASSLPIAGENNGISLLANIDFRESLTTSGTYELTLAVVVAIGIWSAALASSRLGRRFLTLRASEELCSSLGISVYRTKCFAFLLSALPAGLAGALYVYAEQFISPGSVPATLSVYVLAACVIGGLGTVWGPVVGGLIVFGLNQALGGAAQYQGILFGILLAVVVVLIPGGILSLTGGRLTAARVAIARFGRKDSMGLSSHQAAVTVPSAESANEQPGWTLAARPAEGVLSAERVSRSFGGVLAVNDVDLKVTSGQVHAVVGSNGSGKTTLLNLLSGFYGLQGGVVRLDGAVISGRGPRFVANCGIARTFQTPKLVAEQTLLFNVMIGADRSIKCRDSAAVLRLPAGRRAERAARDLATTALGSLGLDVRCSDVAGEAPHGIQRLVEVARALTARPRFIMLDEPAAGLNTHEVEALGRLLKTISGQGVGVLLVEHNLEFVRSVADAVTMMHEGKVLATGTPAEVDADPMVRQLFIGRSASEGSGSGKGASAQDPRADVPHQAAAVRETGATRGQRPG